MSQAAVRLRDPVDLEEFERKLRSAAGDTRQSLVASPAADPLQELSRLIGVEKDPFDQMFAAGPKTPAPPAAPPVVASPVHVDEAEFERLLERELHGHAPDHAFEAHARAEEEQDISALLNQFPDAAARFAAAAPTVPLPAHGFDGAPYAGDPSFVADDDYRPAYESRDKPSRRPLLLMGGALVVLIGGIGAVLVSRAGGPGAGGAPTIQASNAPVKIAPAAPAPEQAQQAVSVLDKSNMERLAGSRVVTREEQPVDIQAQARANRPEATGATTPSVAPGGGLFPEPRRVKTVSVRPDGSVISGDASAAKPAAPTPPVVARTPTTTALANNPPVTDRTSPTPPAAGKTTARATPPTDTATPRPRPADKSAADKPADKPAAGTTIASGDFAVQLAAPGSEAEARTVITNLGKRYAGDLGARKLSFRKATVGEKSVYRVRVAGLSQEGATSLCTKLQAKGGNCFVARN